MTLEEYYEALKKIEYPEGLEWYEEIDYAEKVIDELRTKLSKKDLKKVLREEKDLNDRMQSSVG